MQCFTCILKSKVGVAGCDRAINSGRPVERLSYDINLWEVVRLRNHKNY